MSAKAVLLVLVDATDDDGTATLARPVLAERAGGSTSFDGKLKWLREQGFIEVTHSAPADGRGWEASTYRVRLARLLYPARASNGVGATGGRSPEEAGERAAWRRRAVCIAGPRGPSRLDCRGEALRFEQMETPPGLRPPTALGVTMICAQNRIRVHVGQGVSSAHVAFLEGGMP